MSFAPITHIFKVLGLSAVALVCATGLASADTTQELKDKAEIESLIYCYARGADTIGSGKTQSDPEAAGFAILKTCFTDNATFGVWPVGMPFDREAFPSRTGSKPPAVIVEGTVSWASSINAAFRGAGGVGYDFVQHLLSNVHVDVKGNDGKLSAYLVSTHIIQGEQPFSPSRCHQQSNGTYSLRVKKIGGTWKVTSLDLTQIAYDIITESGAGCAAPAATQ